MFDQTFVDGTGKTGKPISLFVSTLIQICVLCILLLIPLIYTATLPGAIFKSLLVAPRPPIVSVKPPVRRVEAARMVRTRSGSVVFNPIVIPNRVAPISDVAAPPDLAPIGADGQGGSVTSFPGNVLDAAPQPPALPEEPKPIAHPVRVGTGVAEANLITRVMPLYPSLAKAARIQGSVEFSAAIDKEGRIENLRLLRGHPLLVNAARDAVLQWRYHPTLLNGQPVEVLTEIVVNFTLTQ